MKTTFNKKKKSWIMEENMLMLKHFIDLRTKTVAFDLREKQKYTSLFYHRVRQTCPELSDYEFEAVLSLVEKKLQLGQTDAVLYLACCPLLSVQYNLCFQKEIMTPIPKDGEKALVRIFLDLDIEERFKLAIYTWNHCNTKMASA